MNGIKKDDKLMALLSIWGIILVVLGHSGFTDPIIANKLSLLHNWIYSFHMPLFFFISGYLYSLTNKDFKQLSIPKFLKKKWNRLLIPYFVLGIVVFFIKFFFSSLSSIERSFSIQSFLYMFLAPQAPNSTMGFLWYLITLFEVFVIVIICRQLGINLKKIHSCIILIVTFWTLDALIPDIWIFNFKGLLWNLPFFLIGIIYQIGKTRENNNGSFTLFSYFNSRVQSTIGMVLYIFLLILCKYHISFIEIRIINNIIYALLGIGAAVLLCNGLIINKWVNKTLLPFALETYTIYLLSWFFQYPIQIFCINVLHMNWILSFVLMFIGGLVGPILIHSYVGKISKLRDCKLLIFSIGY